jgi:hypothetical protein
MTRELRSTCPCRFIRLFDAIGGSSKGYSELAPPQPHSVYINKPKGDLALKGFGSTTPCPRSSGECRLDLHRVLHQESSTGSQIGEH